MDAKQLGIFIAERRKELGLTQAALAERLHVTDKAISRWERGIGFPDMGNLESLAAALHVSLLELMQARRTESDHISTKDAEKLLMDTIALSRHQTVLRKAVGSVLTGVFGIVGVLGLCVLFTDHRVVLMVGSLLAGLLAWGIPIWQMTLARSFRTDISAIASLGFGLLALAGQFWNLAREVNSGDTVFVEDTIGGLVSVVAVFVGMTLLLNGLMAKFAKNGFSGAQKG